MIVEYEPFDYHIIELCPLQLITSTSLLLIILWIDLVHFNVDNWYKKQGYDIGNPHFILFSHYPTKKSFFRAQSLNWQEMKTQVFQKMLASSIVYLTKDYQTIYFQVKHNDDIYKRILPTSKNLFS